MIGHWDGWWGPGWGLLAGLAWAAFWVLVIFFVVGLVRRGGGDRGQPSAVRMLEDRYARGEIGREEFLERRAIILGERRGGDAAE